MRKWTPFLPLIAPLLILGGMIFFLFTPRQSDDSDQSGASPSSRAINGDSQPVEVPSSSDGWTALPLSGLSPGESIPGWQIEQGAFRVVDWNGQRVLELGPEPMTEGLLRQSNRFNYGGVRALMGGESHRRVAPRFSVSLEGQRPYALRAAPTHQRLELVTPPEVMLSTANWQWRKDQKLWLELILEPLANEQVRISCRVWHEDEARPEQPQIQHVEPAPKSRYAPTIRGGPFALKSIFIHQVETYKSR